MSPPVLPSYPFVPPPELTGGERKRHPVIVVGAGPVGLALALELDRRGIGSVVVEARDRASEGSRAICISRRSMDILDGIGVGETFRARGLGWVRGRSFYRDEPVFELEMPFPPHERHYPMTNLQQFGIEQILIDRALEARHVDLRWLSRLAGLRADGEGVVCRIETPEGAYDLRGSYLVACDGARSTVRELCGLKLRGTSATGRYLIADIHMKSDHPTERRAWFDPPCLPGGTVLMHRQPDDVWRVDFQLPPDADVERELAEESVRARIGALLGMIGERAPWTLIWRSVYRAHSLALDDYRHGRVFFAGDAAHLVPIFGVRGLNSGLADANNLGWKLAAVLRGLAPDGLLDTYSLERREATMDILRESWKSTIFMTPPTEGYRCLRDAALSLALNTEFTRCLINPRQSVPYDYVDSPLNTFDEGEDARLMQPRTGAPLPNIRLDPEGGDYLHRHLGPDLTVLLCDAGPEGERAARAGLAASGVPAVLVTLGEGGTLPDAEGRVRSVLGARKGEAIVLRPDGHLCARLGPGFSEDRLARALRRAVGAEPAQDARPQAEPAAAAPAEDRVARTEAAFQILSEGLDAVAAAERETFLAKLALLLADRIGDSAALRAAVATARHGLAPVSAGPAA